MTDEVCVYWGNYQALIGGTTKVFLRLCLPFLSLLARLEVCGGAK